MTASASTHGTGEWQVPTQAAERLTRSLVPSQRRLTLNLI